MNGYLICKILLAFSLTIKVSSFTIAQGPLRGEKIGKGGSWAQFHVGLKYKPFVPRDDKEKRVVQKSQMLLKKLGINIPHDATIKVCLKNSDTLSYLVDFSPYVEITYALKTNSISMLGVRNEMIELSTKSRLHSNIDIRDNSSLSKHALALYKLSGLPKSYKLSSIVDFGKEHDRWTVRISFDPMPFGFSVRAFEECALFFEIPSGILSCITQSYPRKYEVESHIATLTFNQAKATAEPIASKYQVGKYRPNELAFQDGSIPRPNLFPSALEYVCPNGRFRGLDYGFPVVLKLRLAWRLRYPRNEEIWIDAGDGKVLGGFYKDRP